jgi:hypothetical protein
MNKSEEATIGRLTAVLDEIISELIPPTDSQGKVWTKSIIFLDLTYLKGKPGLMAIIKAIAESPIITADDPTLYQVKIYCGDEIATFRIEISTLTPGLIIYKGWCDKDFQIQQGENSR